MTSPLVADLDPFDLPDWLGDGPVSWASDQAARPATCRRSPDRHRRPEPPVRPARRRPGLPGAGARRGHPDPGPPDLAARPGPAPEPRRTRHRGCPGHGFAAGPGARSAHPAGSSAVGADPAVAHRPDLRRRASRLRARRGLVCGRAPRDRPAHQPDRGQGRGRQGARRGARAAARRRAERAGPAAARRRRGAGPGPRSAVPTASRRSWCSVATAWSTSGSRRSPRPASRSGSSRPAPATTWPATSTSRARTRSRPRTVVISGRAPAGRPGPERQQVLRHRAVRRLRRARQRARQRMTWPKGQMRYNIATLVRAADLQAAAATRSTSTASSCTSRR